VDRTIPKSAEAVQFVWTADPKRVLAAVKSSFRRLAAKWIYRELVWMFACPIAAWISGPVAPPIARWLATECLSPWRVNPAGRPAAAFMRLQVLLGRFSRLPLMTV
jgi:hypothetical protein